jgi:hypothetical protein
MYQTALARYEEDQALLDPLDVTPIFSALAPGVGTLSQGAPSWRGLGASPSRPRESAATSVATQRQVADHLDRLFAAVSQTMIADADAEQIWVVPLWAQPAELVGDFHPWSPPTLPTPPSPAQAALAAVADLQRWLAIGQDQVATLAGYAPRSVKNWRGQMDPYPATVRRLFDVHALISSLTRAMGTEGARLWLADVGNGETSRRDRIVDDAGLRSVISEASTALFEPPSVAPLHDLDFDEEVPAAISRRPDLFSGPVRRARLRP